MNAELIKGYELCERIGAGGCGAVYRAHQTSIGREVAVKIVLPDLANQPEFIRRFESEAQVVARLEHPHIVPLHDYWRDSEGAYLVMRWLKGGSLREALQHGPFDLRAAALLLDQIAGALSLAHRSSIIHRDLKPANILFDEDGNAYLSDFGIAKDLNLPNDHTQPDTLVGSLDYISPEQARGEAITARTDIYSLGVTLYEVIMGQHPFEGYSSVERLYKHINDPLPEITTLDAALSAGVNHVIQKATAKDPQYRYADALAFAADFREAAGLNRAPTNVVELLTQREQDILRLIIEGLSNKEIAQRLTVTLSTVKWYVNQIYAKLGVRSRVQAMVRARELNLLGSSSESPAMSVAHTEEFHPENPYKGLRAFTAADYKDYFGREKLTDKLVRKLSESTELARFLAIVGPSGSGKSSLVKAGLVPAIWKGMVPGSEKWFVVEMLPGSRPLDELEMALTKIAANYSGSIREQLARDEYGLARVASLLLPNDGSDLLLVIDQFEEVFTLVEAEGERQHFLNLIYHAAIAPRSRVRIVVTLRADFYDRPLHYPAVAELMRARMETILPLNAEELERAILKPAEQVGAIFEPGLVTTIVSEVKYQAGALPLLQYALTELFERRSARLLTREAYETIGGTVGALAKRADEIYLDLNAVGQEAARQMFLRLVTLGEGTEDTRRRVHRAELLAILAGSDLMDEVIDTYAEYRLLSLDNDPTTRMPTVELAHEAILREWERLRAWLNESRDDVRLQRQLMALAEDWHSAAQDASFLLRGSRLEVFEKWAQGMPLALTESEREFLNASMTQRISDADIEQSRQARELQLAQDTAKAERRAANWLRILAAVMVAAVLGAFGLSGFALAQSNEAQAARADSEASADASQHLALISGAQAALATGNTDLALALAMEANHGAADSQAQIMLAQAAYAPGTIRRFTEHSISVTSSALSPDGRLAASGDDVGTIYLWNTETGQVLQRLQNSTGGVWGLAFSPDGLTLLSTGNPTLTLWDVATGERIRQFRGHSDFVRRVVFSADGLTALSASEDGTMILWDVAAGQPIRQFARQTDWVGSADFHPDGRRAVSGSFTGEVIVWDLETGESLRHYASGLSEIRSIRFSPDGRTMLMAGGAPVVILMNVEDGAVIHRLEGHNYFVNSVAFNADGTLALSGSADGTLILWDVESGQLLHQYQGHAGPIWDSAFSADGHRALSASWDGTARLWDIQASQVIHRFVPADGHSLEQILEVHVSPDGRYGVTSSRDSTSVLWDMQTGRQIKRFNGISATFTADSSKVLWGVGDWEAVGAAGVFDIATGQEIAHFDDFSAGVRTVSTSPDGETALIGVAAKGDYHLINLVTGDLMTKLNWHDHAIEPPVFSPDGSLIALSGWDFTIALMDVNANRQLHTLSGHPESVMSLAFSPDSAALLTGSLDKSVIMWDVAAGEILRRFTDHSGAVFAVAFSPDGSLVVSGSADRTLIIRDKATGEILRRYTGLHSGIYSIAFSPDGSQLLVGYVDGSVELWRIDVTEDLIGWTQANRYVPELTCEQRARYRLEPLCAEATTP